MKCEAKGWQGGHAVGGTGTVSCIRCWNVFALPPRPPPHCLHVRVKGRELLLCKADKMLCHGSFKKLLRAGDCWVEAWKWPNSLRWTIKELLAVDPLGSSKPQAPRGPLGHSPQKPGVHRQGFGLRGSHPMVLLSLSPEQQWFE